MKQWSRNIWIMLVVATFLVGCGERAADEPESSEPEPPATEMDSPQTIAEQLTERREAAQAQMPAETLNTMKGATDDLRQAGIVEGALNVGGKIPPFVLSDAVGNTVNIEDLQSAGPLVLTFYRGAW